MVSSEEYFKKWDIIGSFVNVLKDNFFQDFIIVMLAKFDWDIIKDTQIQLMNFFFHFIDWSTFECVFSKDGLLHTDSKHQYSEIFLSVQLSFVDKGIIFRFVCLWHKYYLIMGFKVCETQRNWYIDLFFIGFMKTFDFCVLPLWDWKAYISGFCCRSKNSPWCFHFVWTHKSYVINFFFFLLQIKHLLNSLIAN